jgi:hypothetical protein
LDHERLARSIGTKDADGIQLDLAPNRQFVCATSVQIGDPHAGDHRSNQRHPKDRIAHGMIVIVEIDTEAAARNEVVRVGRDRVAFGTTVPAPVEFANGALDMVAAVALESDGLTARTWLWSRRVTSGTSNVAVVRVLFVEILRGTDSLLVLGTRQRAVVLAHAIEAVLLPTLGTDCERVALVVNVVASNEPRRLLFVLGRCFRRSTRWRRSIAGRCWLEWPLLQNAFAVRCWTHATVGIGSNSAQELELLEAFELLLVQILRCIALVDQVATAILETVSLPRHATQHVDTDVRLDASFTKFVTASKFIEFYIIEAHRACSNLVSC